MMGKNLWSDKEKLFSIVEKHNKPLDINFVIDPLELLETENFLLNHFGLNLFYSIKTVDKLHAFLDRLITYITDHKKKVDADGSQYNIFIIVIPQFKIKEFYKKTSKRIKDLPINIYYFI
jgi:hypothetical protein